MIDMSRELPEEIKQSLKSEAEKAFESLIDSDSIQSVVIPVHTSNMRVLEDGRDKIEKVIVPAMRVIIPDAAIQDNHLVTRSLKYIMDDPFKQRRRVSLPISHVFRSGSLCLGTIFVPQLIPSYSPMQPIETLLLANDRNMSHGNPRLAPLRRNRLAILDLTSQYVYDEQTQQDILNTSNWATNDLLWRITNRLLEHTDNKDQAFALANRLFALAFAD